MKEPLHCKGLTGLKAALHSKLTKFKFARNYCFRWERELSESFGRDDTRGTSSRHPVSYRNTDDSAVGCKLHTNLKVYTNLLEIAFW